MIFSCEYKWNQNNRGLEATHRRGSKAEHRLWHLADCRLTLRCRGMASSASAPESSRQSLVRRSSSGFPPILLDDDKIAGADEQSIAGLDMPKMLMLGSCMYTVLNCITYPLAVVKTRLQASVVRMSPSEAAAEIMCTTGFRGFYAGLLPVLVGALPARAGYIVALEGTRPHALRLAEQSGLKSPAAAAVSNGVAGFSAVLASQIIYCPCDVVTQRMMVAGVGGAGATAADASFSAVVSSIFATQGLGGFYRGIGVTPVASSGLLGGSVLWWGAYLTLTLTLT